MTFPIPVDHSLEALLPTSRIRTLYPDDVFHGGAYAPLVYGRTRYWLFGPQDGRKVVLIHGLSIPAITWKEVAPVMAEKGFRVLVYDLYGKGYSEAPRVKSETVVFVTQLAMLMQYIGWDKAAIVGFSMGGGITAAFTSTMPHLVDGQAVLIASAGITRKLGNQMTKSQEQSGANASFTPTRGPASPISSMAEVRELQHDVLPGYERSLLSCMSDGPIKHLDQCFDTIRKMAGVKTLIIHGTDDTTVPYSHSQVIKDKIPAAELYPVKGIGHDLLLVEPFVSDINAKLVEFLSP